VKDFGKVVRDRLNKVGCSFLRHGKGDHGIWTTPEGKRIVVPVQIDPNGILKEAGLSKAF
jgi:predicted RNA binding protein YcfA (HicA-like mRNA interferase family)